MPGLVLEGAPGAGPAAFKTIHVKELHPTFGAEVEGVDFPNPSEEQFRELLAAMAKVRFFFLGPSFLLHPGVRTR